MAIPLKFILLAAQIAQDERAQKVVKSVWRSGAGLISKRRAASGRTQAAARPLPDQPANPDGQSAKAGWRMKLGRKMRFRNRQAGDLIIFDYTDAHGLKTHRMVGNWHCAAGELTGYCLNHKQELVFTVSGIGQWEEIEVPCLD